MSKSSNDDNSTLDIMLVVGTDSQDEMPFLEGSIKKSVLNFGIIGDGTSILHNKLQGKPGTNTITHLLGHGVSEDDDHYIEINEELVISSSILGEIAEIHHNKMANVHMWSCESHRAAKYAASLGGGSLITHSGPNEKLISMFGAQDIVNEINQYTEHSQKYKDNSQFAMRQAFARNIITYPENIVYSTTINNKVVQFQACAPDDSPDVSKLEVSLRYRLEEFYKFRRDELGEDIDIEAELMAIFPPITGNCPEAAKQARKDVMLRYQERDFAVSCFNEDYKKIELYTDALKKGKTSSELNISNIMGLIASTACDVFQETLTPEQQLSQACLSGDIDTIKNLLAENKSLARDENKHSDDAPPPVFVACAGAGTLQVISLLHNNGSDINYVAPHGVTSLYVTCQNGKTDCVDFLIKHGANTKQGLYNEFTPLMAAAITGKEEVVKLLLNSIQDRSSLTKICDKEAVEKFCKEKGFPITEQTLPLLGKSAVEMAEIKGYANIATMIKQRVIQLVDNPRQPFSGHGTSKDHENMGI